MVDTTFKPVHGDTNEWKIVVWKPETHQRVVCSRIWCNRKDRASFRALWNGVFDAVKEATGRPLNFKVFDPKCSLLGVLADEEAAQALGLADSLNDQKSNNATISGIHATGEDLLFYILKTCWVHWCRNIDKLASYTDDATLSYLRNFPFLTNDEAINGYTQFCLTSPIKQIRDWWENKAMHRWIAPSINRYLSKMPRQNWDLMPADSNAMEGSHADDNRKRGTNRSLVEAILVAQKSDAETAKQIAVSASSGILPNRNNTQQDRYSHQIGRKASALRQQSAHREAINKYSAVQDEIRAITEESKAINARKKQLQEQLKATKIPSSVKLASKIKASVPIPSLSTQQVQPQFMQGSSRGPSHAQQSALDHTIWY